MLAVASAFCIFACCRLIMMGVKGLSISSSATALAAFDSAMDGSFSSAKMAVSCCGEATMVLVGVAEGAALKLA